MLGVCRLRPTQARLAPSVTTHLGGLASAQTVQGDSTQQQQQPLHSTGSQAKLRTLGDAEMLPSRVPSMHYTCCITEFIRPAGIALQVR